MKALTTVLSLICIISLSSCIDDFHGNGGEEIEFTATNTLYEGDLYSIYLTGELDVINALIAQLEAVSPNDPNYDQAQADLVEAKDRKTYLKLELVNIPDPVTRGVKPPPPPPPCPGSICLGDLQYLLAGSNTTIVELIMLDDAQEVLAEIDFDNPEPVPGFENEFNYLETSLEGYSGPIFVLITRTDLQGELVSYNADIFVE